MKTLIILCVTLVVCLGFPAPAYQNVLVNDDGTYQFSYETGNEGGSHSRTESKGPDGSVVGKYSYKDPTGDLRVVNYRADERGFMTSEDGEIPQSSASGVPTFSEEATVSELSEKDKEEDNGKVTVDEDEEDDDEDDKSLNLEEPIDQSPPDGFPLGFFSGQFSALRRLPEPVKEEKDENKDEKKLDMTSTVPNFQGNFGGGLPEGFPPGFFFNHFTGLRRFEDPLQNQAPAQNSDGVHQFNNQGTSFSSGIPQQAIHNNYMLPYPKMIPQMWPTASNHQPVYVYSYQNPNAYAYSYYY